MPIGSGTGVALNELEIGSVRADYLLHTVVFLPWMILVWLYLNAKNISGRQRFNHAIRWFYAGLFLAVFSEGIQYWLPYRAFNPLDLIFNVSGVVVGTVIFVWSKGARALGDGRQED